MNDVDNVTTLQLIGTFNFSAHGIFREFVDKALVSSSRTISLNFREVTYLDSAALGMLLMLRERAESLGKCVAITHENGLVKKVLEVANFQELFALT
jgi:anti-anti-sigma factor